MFMDNLKKGAVAVVTMISILTVDAVAAFPDKPITIVVPWKAGSSPDVSMRVVGEIASRDLGQPVVVQNIVGGSGSKGTLAVKNQGNRI